jgi:riboflavin kinase/FMN adenylyltransferase
MRVSYYPEIDLRTSARPVATLGNFDGVHRGHQRALSILRERSRELEAPSVAVTFEPHPVSVLRPERAPRRILTPQLKVELLGGQSIDHLVIVHFTREFSEVSAEQFVKEMLVGKLRVSELVLGADFRFGHGREGDVEFLRRMGERYDFVVHEVEGFEHRGEIVSSSRIRRTLEEGAVDEAAEMLGRPYFFDATVIRGDGRGRQIGFPTANLKVEGEVLVGDGVYATEAAVSGQSLPGMSHVGRRPTFGLEDRTVETHLFDFDRDLYGASLRLHFHRRIRGTVKFPSAEALRDRLRLDREEAIAALQGLRARGRNLVV